MRGVKTLVVGDVHCKQHILNNVKKALEKRFNVAMVGDYVDDWKANVGDNYQTMQTLVELKTKHPRSLALIIGNHDLSEGYGIRYPELRCGGFKVEVAEKVGPIIRDFVKNKAMTVALEVEGYTISHAGLTYDWFKGHNKIDSVNELLFKEDLYSLQKLNMCGIYRGGQDNFSGPLWAAKIELDLNHTQRLPKQIVGHTPVETCINEVGENKDLWFIDTFSTNSFGNKIGDETILILEDGKVQVTTFEKVLNED